MLNTVNIMITDIKKLIRYITLIIYIMNVSSTVLSTFYGVRISTYILIKHVYDFDIICLPIDLINIIKKYISNDYKVTLEHYYKKIITNDIIHVDLWNGSQCQLYYSIHDVNHSEVSKSKSRNMQLIFFCQIDHDQSLHNVVILFLHKHFLKCLSDNKYVYWYSIEPVKYVNYIHTPQTELLKIIIFCYNMMLNKHTMQSLEYSEYHNKGL